MWVLALVASLLTVAAPRETREERVRALRQRTWEMWAAPLEGQLRIDGRLDEPAWARAEPASEFYQGERNEGLPATERTEVRVLYDQTNLYVGVRCFDREPQRVKARSIFREELASGDDLILIALDAFHDHRSSVQFVTNPNGLMVDTLQTGETAQSRNPDWDTVWQARGSRDEQGWAAEVVIPFKSLRFEVPASSAELVFGIGFKRNIPRKNEEPTWPFVSNDSSWYRPAELGHLRGLRNIRPGRSLEIRPYLLGGANRDFVLGTPMERRGDAGLDVKWGVTPNLTADFSVNTDFAQEEADLQQINLTRFSLFFPEKRQFFLEGQRMFQFGVAREADFVFTRRMGLSDAGEVIPIRAGARLSGRHGRLSLGLMNLETEEAHGLPSENFTVLRVRSDLFKRSSVGALFTNREGGGRFNRVFGTDLNLLFREYWSLEVWFARLENSTTPGGADALFTRFAYETDRLGVSYRLLDLDQAFLPGVGFVRRPGARENSGEFRYSPRPGLRGVRQLSFRAALGYVSDQNNVLETREQGAEFTTTFETGDALSFEYTDLFEFIPVPFELRSDVVIPTGAYRTDTVAVRLNTGRRRWVRGNVRVGTGGFWDGRRDTVSLRGEYRVSKHLEVGGNYEANWVELPSGRFTTHLVASRIMLALRSDVVVQSLFQYNHDTGLFSTNLRFNWIPKPGTDFFIVYNELDDWPGGLGVRHRSLAVKLNYLFAF